MEIIELTNNLSFNFFASIYLWASLPTVLAVSILSILRN